MPASSRSPLLPLAALVLLLDGLVAWLLSGVVLLMSTAVGAIEGRTGNSNGHLVWWALGLFLVGIVAFVGAWRALRGPREAQLIGVPVTGLGALVAAYAAVSSATTNPVDVRAFGVTLAILLAQLAATVVLTAGGRRVRDEQPRSTNELE